MHPLVLSARQSALPPRLPDRPKAIALATLMAASTDLLSAFLYWGRRGVAPDAILRTVARWVTDVPLAAPVTALTAFATLLALYLPAVIVLDAGVARRLHLARSPMRTGVLWGLLAYVALFRIVVPFVVQPASLDASAGWLATCIVVHALAIGPAAVTLIGRTHALPVAAR